MAAEAKRSAAAPPPPAAMATVAATATAIAPARGAGRWGAAAVAALTALVLAWAGGFAALVWLDAAPAERAAGQALLAPRAGLVFLFTLGLPLVMWLVVRFGFAPWPRSARRLAGEVSLLASAHAGHRVGIEGPGEMRELAGAVDRFASAHTALVREVEQRVEQASAERAAETRRLAALMSELTMAVLVCNREGRVLLYNGRAAALPGADGALGLGRPVTALLDAAALEHAWQQVLRRSDEKVEGTAPMVVRFVTPIGAAATREHSVPTLLRVQMVPVPDDAGVPAGYVLLAEDVTHPAGEERRRETLLRGLTEGLRASLGSLRAAAQALAEYPAMDAGRRAGLSRVVHLEAERLAAQLAAALSDAPPAASAAWLLDDVPAAELLWALQRALAAARPPIGCVIDHDPQGRLAEPRLRVDSHAVVQALAALAGRLRNDRGAHDFALALAGAPAAPRLELRWRGRPLEPGTLEEWEQADQASLRQLLDRHGAELWAAGAGAGAEDGEDGDADEGGKGGEGGKVGEDRRQRLCLQFDRAAAIVAASHAPRPIAYDFDLFHQPGQTAVLDETPLAALACTVFDTETTGLRPSEGDEIIAIGAVRIVNGRVLEHERFDRRVRPTRPVRASAEAVHGISTAALAGEPPLEEVLGAFARFCEGTVLVAHNAAFDMRFLELARARTGVGFDQPVLDTMLLSAAALPGHRSDEHHLEQVAARLGVPVAERHQALGDAVITARVFVQLVPLLAARGIGTLGQARSASRGVAHPHEAY